ncbi:MAG TPA: choice-of-anchor Q domain-containing protein, partial [Lacipirellulaceae bacterium]|nr:choice-of-anchor Q domain-containing protein [Lacipirellulaceae bacterium]
MLAVVTVDTLADTVDLNDGVTSLREALFATNLVSGADTVEFAPSLTSGGPGTILLTQGELKISDDLTINALGASLTIDASGNDATPDRGDGSRIFNINDGHNDRLLNVTINGLALTGGDSATSGGAILNFENLTLNGSTVDGNSAGADGGGIWTRGGSLSIINSTISGNVAGDEGGGVYMSLPEAGSLAIRHSTITANEASARGGGMFIAQGTLALENTILAANHSAIGPDLTGLLGAVVQARFNFIGDNSGSGLAEAPIGAPDANGNLIGGSGSGPIDPMLGPLTDNGGPLPTYALLLGSAAIDAGDPAAVAGSDGVPEFDQRGTPFVRVAAGRVDIGAFELPSSEIHGAKWNDLNGNGLWEQPDEPGLADWTIFLDANHNGRLDDGEISTTTGPDGSYALTDIPAGDHSVAEVLQPGWQQTSPGGAVDTSGLVINGGFETGDFSGWTLENSGSGTFVVNDGIFDPGGPDGPLPPYDGSYASITTQTGPGTHTIYQDVAVPVDGPTTLHWVDQIRNHATSFADPNQEYRVEIRNTANQLLA